uniref:deaminase domain-containing protein n=1 Tax=Iodobacter sp. CM08 TaxID=3085902 RepID=UPI0039905724
MIAKARVELNSGRDAENFLANKWFDLKDKAAQVRLDANLNVLNEKGHLPGNLATATIRVDGKMPVEVKAYSSFGNDANSVVNGFAILPPESERILQPLVGSKSPINRANDTEYKILENFAQQYKMNNKVSATVDLFTERSPCVSCTDVISRQFLERFPNVEVRVYHNNGKIITYKEGNIIVDQASVPKNAPTWPTLPEKATFLNH